MSMPYNTVLKSRCKRCATQFVRRSHEQKAFESLLRRFSFYPFRCQLCRYRFYLMRRGGMPETKTERREYLRVPVLFPVKFSGDKFDGEGTVSNLSIQGCTMESSSRPGSGATLTLTLKTQEYRLKDHRRCWCPSPTAPLTLIGVRSFEQSLRHLKTFRASKACW